MWLGNRSCFVSCSYYPSFTYKLNVSPKEISHKAPYFLINLWLPKGKRGVGWDKSGAWGEHTHTTIHKTDTQQGPTV